MMLAIVPAKTLEQAKTRLAPVLSPDERGLLSLAMLRDVLSALRGALSLDRVAVITADAALAAEASALGAEVLPEQSVGQNAALEAGAAYCQEQGADALLVVSADLPLLRPAAVEQFIAQSTRADQRRLVLLAPSREATGTNAMLQRPPGVIPFLFGTDSRQRHQQAAAERGIALALARLPELALDIDTPDDLLELAAAPGHTQTQAALAQMRFLKRARAPFYRETSIP